MECVSTKTASSNQLETGKSKNCLRSKNSFTNGVCDGCKVTRSARSSSVPRGIFSAGHPQMERPGFEPPLCAMSTNRSLSATIRKYLWTGAAFFIEGWQKGWGTSDLSGMRGRHGLPSMYGKACLLCRPSESRTNSCSSECAMDSAICALTRGRKRNGICWKATCK